jgi:hypothetical protein
MNRSDLLKKYSEETSNPIELLEKLLDFTKTNLEVLKYINWLEGNKIPTFDNLEVYKDYVKETADIVIKHRFINEVKMRMTGLELLNYQNYDKMLREIPENIYAYVLTLLEKHTMEEVKFWWTNHGKRNVV